MRSFNMRAEKEPFEIEWYIDKAADSEQCKQKKLQEERSWIQIFIEIKLKIIEGIINGHLEYQ